MLEQEALEYYEISQSKLNKLNLFCDNYILDYKFKIIDLMYYEYKLVKIDNEIKKLLEDKIIKANTNYIDIVENFSKQSIYELIPNIKEEFVNIGLSFKKTINADDLRAKILENKNIFEKYFKDYALISLTKYYENYLYEYQEYIEDYCNTSHWLPPKQENKTYNMPEKFIVQESLKDVEQTKQEIRKRIQDIREQKEKPQNLQENKEVIYLQANNKDNKEIDMPAAQFWGLLFLFLLSIIFIISCFIGIFS